MSKNPITIVSKKLEKLTPEERERVYQLTLDTSSAMRDVLDDYDTYEYERLGIRAFLARQHKTIIGWSMVLPYCDYEYSTDGQFKAGVRLGSGIYVFVDKEHRRKGVGTQLLKRSVRYAKRKAKEVRVHPWDHTSEEFYKSISQKLGTLRKIGYS